MLARLGPRYSHPKNDNLISRPVSASSTSSGFIGARGSGRTHNFLQFFFSRTGEETYSGIHNGFTRRQLYVAIICARHFSALYYSKMSSSPKWFSRYKMAPPPAVWACPELSICLPLTVGSLTLASSRSAHHTPAPVRYMTAVA